MTNRKSVARAIFPDVTRPFLAGNPLGTQPGFPLPKMQSNPGESKCFLYIHGRNAVQESCGLISCSFVYYMKYSLVAVDIHNIYDNHVIEFIIIL
jgi:hypothetical protein